MKDLRIAAVTVGENVVETAPGLVSQIVGPGGFMGIQQVNLVYEERAAPSPFTVQPFLVLMVRGTEHAKDLEALAHEIAQKAGAALAAPGNFTRH